MELGIDKHPTSEEEPSSPLRVLQVEDEAPLRAVLGRSLATLGINFESASNGREAISLFEGTASPFNVLLTDYDMPGMNGAELIRELKKRNPDLISILLSGRDSDDSDIQETLGGIVNDYYLQKPTSLDALQQVADAAKITLEERERAHGV
jgi:CheY-like chemotaxis protein